MGMSGLDITIESLETALVALIKTGVENVNVLKHPNNPDIFELTGKSGAILVHYDGSTFENTQSSVIKQIRTIRFSFILYFYNLRVNEGQHGNNGVYSVLDDLRKAVTGYINTGQNWLSKLYITREDFVSFEEGVWRYDMEAEFKVLYSQNF